LVVVKNADGFDAVDDGQNFTLNNISKNKRAQF
jgi:hypothetical protein